MRTRRRRNCVPTASKVAVVRTVKGRAVGEQCDYSVARADGDDLSNVAGTRIDLDAVPATAHVESVGAVVNPTRIQELSVKSLPYSRQAVNFHCSLRARNAGGATTEILAVETKEHRTIRDQRTD